MSGVEEDGPLLTAIGRVLKHKFAEADTRVAALEARIAVLEAQLNLEQRVQALEAGAQQRTGLRAVGGER